MRRDRWRNKNENAREIWDEDEGGKEETKWTRDILGRSRQEKACVLEILFT